MFVHDAFGNLAAEYNPPVAAACMTCYLSWDHLGSTRMVTDAGGNIVARHDYLPFGVEIPRSWSVTDGLSPKFTGQDHDSETLLEFYQARYLAAGLGRYMSVDPGNAGADPTDPQTWNMYSYVRNRPLTFTDPGGLDECDPSTGDCGDCGDDPSCGGGCDPSDPFCGGGCDPSCSGGTNPSNPGGHVPGVVYPATGPQVGPGSGVANGLQPQSSSQPNQASQIQIQQQLALAARLLRYLLHKPWELSWIFPLAPEPGVFGIGPAGSLVWNPDTHNFCASVGLGGSAGHNIALGPLTNGWTPEGKPVSSKEMDEILSGWSISGGLNFPAPSGPGPGVQVTANSSGTAIGPTVGSPGVSISITWAACGKLW